MSEARRAKHRSDDPAAAARLAVVGLSEKDAKEMEKKSHKKEKKDKKDKPHRSRASEPSVSPVIAAPAATRGPRPLIPSSASAPLGGGNRGPVRQMAPARAPAEELLDHVLSVPPAEAPAALAEFACAYRYFLLPRELLLQLITRFKNAPAVGRYAPEEVQRDWKARTGEAVRGRVMALLEAWVSEHFYDFEDDDVLFRSLLAFLDSSHASLPAPVGRVRLAIQNESDEPILRLFGPALEPPMVTSALRKNAAASLFTVRSDGSASVSGADLHEWLLANTAATSRTEASNIATSMLRQSLLIPHPLSSPSPSATSEFRSEASALYCLNPPLTIAPSPKTLPNTSSALDSFLALDVDDVARQLTLVAHELFCRVRPADLKPSLAPASLSLSDGGHGSAVQTLQALHDRTACWVASEVVLSKAASERAAMLARFVSLAAALHALRNYHGLFAVMAGLALKPVERLRSSWRALSAESTAQYEALSEVVNPASAFAVYRSELAQAPLPSFPQLSLIIADVRALESSSSDFADELRRDVNYKKLRAFASIFAMQVRRYQRQPFPLAPVPAVQEYLARAVVVAHPADLFKISLQCEPLA